MTEAHLFAILSAPLGALLAVRAAQQGAASLEATVAPLPLAWSALAAVGAALLAASAQSSSEAFAIALFGSGLVYLAAFDLFVLAIPVAPTLFLTIAGVATAGAFGGAWEATARAILALAAWGALRAIDLTYVAVRGRSGLGAGDALIGAAITAWLGVAGFAWSLTIAAAASLAWARKRARQAPFPFAPALAFGAFLVALVRGFAWGQL